MHQLKKSSKIVIAERIEKFREEELDCHCIFVLNYVVRKFKVLQWEMSRKLSSLIKMMIKKFHLDNIQTTSSTAFCTNFTNLEYVQQSGVFIPQTGCP